MIKEIKDFERKEIFDYYNTYDNPFIIISTPIDITNVVNYCKKNGNYYATFGYLITKAVNEIDNFRYRYDDKKFYFCDVINSNYTDIASDGIIRYFNVPIDDNIENYIKNYKTIKEKTLNGEEYSSDYTLDEIWMSCTPWYSYTSLIPPFSKKINIPQFIWDKYQTIDGKYITNLTIMVHHGFADGSHIDKFIKKLTDNINNLKI